MLEWLKWKIAGKELAALHRYRLACQEAYRWNATIPESALTADWIRAVGEGERGLDPQVLRDLLRPTE